jgi:hypothetical protein
LTSIRIALAYSLTLALAASGCSLSGSGAPASPSDGSAASAGTGVVLPPKWTDTPSPTVAPPTLTATPTPPFGLAWATSVPVDADFDGWVRLESKRAALWLPPGFEAMDLGGFGEVMALMMYAMTEAMGQMAGELASEFATPIPGRPTPTLISLEELQETIVFDFIVAGSEADQAALFLVGDPPQADTDLGMAIEDTLDSFEGEHTIEAQHAIADRPYPMARLIVSTTNPETDQPSRQLVYVFILDGRAWSLTYVAPVERFEALLPLFEQSAASFEQIG